MKNIIALTDFSANANNATHYAASLAEAAKARLILYHAFPYPVIATDVPVEIQQFIDETTETHIDKLLEIRHALEKQYDIEINCVAEGGSVAYRLHDLMLREKADLAVMGLRGTNQAMNILMGSTTFEVMRQGKSPLLIVPHGVAFQAPKHILFACDNPLIANAATIKPLKAIVSQFDAGVEVYMVNPPEPVPSAQQATRPSNLEQHFENIRHVYTFERAAGVRESILEGIRNSHADMLVMIPHHRSIWQYLFDKSDTHSVALQTSIPILVLAENAVSFPA